MKVADLRAECEKKGLDSSGKKAELVSRLEGILGVWLSPHYTQPF